MRRPIFDGCEYNPVRAEAAIDGDEHNSTVPAAWIVGHNGTWRLCEACAALPIFAKFRSRKRIVVRSASMTERGNQ
jgi:hypothetical protein